MTATDEVALAGADGQQAARLLARAQRAGVAVLGQLAGVAVRRLLEKRNVQRSTRLFTDAERGQLARALASTTATSELLGRARIRRRAAQLETVTKHNEDDAHPGPVETLHNVDPSTVDPWPDNPRADSVGQRAAGMVEALKRGEMLPPPLYLRKPDGRLQSLRGHARTEAYRRLGRTIPTAYVVAPEGSGDAGAAGPDRGQGAGDDDAGGVYAGPGRHHLRDHGDDSPTDFACFDEDAGGIHPMTPRRALDYFLGLVPGLDVPAAGRFTDGHERRAFRIAGVVETSLLQRIKGIIAERLRTGEGVGTAPREIDAVLDAAGVIPRNPGRAEAIFRTEMMGAYNRGAMEEIQSPDMQAAFPVWKYASIIDGRQRPKHGERNGRYYPSSRSFEEVRGTGPEDVIQCRCTLIPIHRRQWKRLQEQGARVEG